MDDNSRPGSLAQQPAQRPASAVKVKICGLTNLADARAAAAAGADLLGFIFYTRSPRYIAPADVRAITAHLRGDANRCPRLVGVFVNASLAQVVETLDTCDLDLAQLHGDEPPELLAALAGRAFKALRPRDEAEARRQAERFACFSVDGGPDLLVDAYHPTLRGGAGQTGDWASAAELSRQYRLLLAGGLTPDNVAAAIGQVRPWGVDVASGVEAAPGRKDHARLEAFIAAVRAAGAQASAQRP